jgi:subtilisin-like proprotein convertase family protein
MFGKKKTGKIGRRLPVPEEHVEKVAELTDAYAKQKTNVTYYQLWKFIHEIFPETKEGRWQLNTADATRYFAEERL